MIKKFLNIKGVGRFQNYTPTGNVDFHKFNIIYGDNGSGKTTISNILCSLQENSPDTIVNKKSFGYADQQNICILFDDNSKIYFKNEGWDTIYNDIYVFNTYFIDDHVISGYEINHNHRKKLYHFVSTHSISTVSKEFSDIKQHIEEINTQIKTKKEDIEKIAGSMPINEFIVLEQDDEIDTKICDIDKKIFNQKNKEKIIKQAMVKIANFMPDLIDEINIILGTTINTIQQKTLDKVNEHLKKHSTNDIESRISQGKRFILNKECPFCSQSLDANTLVEAYNDYFNDEYETLKTTLSEKASLISDLGFKECFPVSDNQISHKALIDAGIDFGEITLEFDDTKMQSYLKSFKTQLLDSVINKQNNLLEKAVYDGSETLIAINGLIAEYNTIIDKIEEKKQTYLGSLGTDEILESERNRLKCIKNRGDHGINEICIAYTSLLSEKETLEISKNEKKETLDKMIDETFSKYGEEINSTLSRFNASYKIDNLKGGIKGASKEVSVDFELNFGTFEGTPNNFSDGDRTTFAFAMFFSKLKSDLELKNKIVVIDDPFSSLDAHRLSATRECIERIDANCKQLIILTHSTLFLREIYRIRSAHSKKFLIINSIDEFQSSIQEYNIDDLLLDQYFDDISKTYHFLNNLGSYNTNDDLRSMARKIRPILEKYLTVKYPIQLGKLKDKWLGDYISMINQSVEGDSLYTFQKTHISELEAINNYSKKFHHKTNDKYDDEIINKNELKGFIERMFTLISS